MTEKRGSWVTCMTDLRVMPDKHDKHAFCQTQTYLHLIRFARRNEQPTGPPTELLMHCKDVLVWKVSTCDAGFRFYNKSVLHEQQKRSSFRDGERAFLMRNRHQEALSKSVTLGHASQTSGVMQNVHDKPGILPDPDTFAFDTTASSATFRTGRSSTDCGYELQICLGPLGERSL